MAWFAAWSDRRSLFIGEPNEEKARAIALEVGEVAPERFEAVPLSAVVIEVFDADDPEDPICCEFLPATAEIFEALEDGDADAEGCDAEATGDGDATLVCELAAQHDGKHRRGAMVW